MKTKFKITNYKKIAIINTAFIGDTVISFFLAQAIKNVHPNSEITFVSTPKVQELIPLIKAIDTHLVYDKRKRDKGIKGFINLIRKLRRNKIELILSPHRSLRTSLITFLSRPKVSVSYTTSSLNFLYTNKVEYLFGYHEVERNLNLLSIFDEFYPNFDLPKVDIFYPKELFEKVEKILSSIKNKRFIVIAPGSIWKTKRWTEEGFIEVSMYFKNNGFKVVLIGSLDDYKICKKIEDRTNALNLAGKVNLAEALLIIKSSELLITNDSSPTHLASLVNCPTITIYGPTIPEFGFYPLSERNRIVQIEKLNCRPCSIHGYNQCPLKHHRCITEIKPEEVIMNANELLFQKN
ncbi:MAG: glycosyltransferase family 9 protein [Ignavibacteria bacterium]|nr:glycosyltransferase family 9 protein [Ignavibacteria bacterium]